MKPRYRLTAVSKEFSFDKGIHVVYWECSKVIAHPSGVPVLEPIATISQPTILGTMIMYYPDYRRRIKINEIKFI